MKESPLVSVVLPVHNAAKFVREAIESILRQTYRNFELILIDDSSVDGTLSLIRTYKDKRIRLVVNNRQLGVVKSLNKGLAKAKGIYVARMDADDISLSTRLEKQVRYLETHPRVGVVGSAAKLIDMSGRYSGVKRFPTSPSELKYRLAWSNPLIHPTVTFRKSLVDRYGLYDEALDGAEDYDLWMRLAKETQLANLPQMLVKYRLSYSSVSFQENRRIENAFMRAKIKSILVYGYPLWHLIFVLKSFVSQLIPIQVKKALVRKAFNYPA